MKNDSQFMVWIIIIAAGLLFFLLLKGVEKMIKNISVIKNTRFLITLAICSICIGCAGLFITIKAVAYDADRGHYSGIGILFESILFGLPSIAFIILGIHKLKKIN